jgi:hypothetical protein
MRDFNQTPLIRKGPIIRQAGVSDPVGKAVYRKLVAAGEITSAETISGPLLTPRDGERLWDALTQPRSTRD